MSWLVLFIMFVLTPKVILYFQLVSKRFSNHWWNPSRNLINLWATSITHQWTSFSIICWERERNNTDARTILSGMGFSLEVVISFEIKDIFKSLKLNTGVFHDDNMSLNSIFRLTDVRLIAKKYLYFRSFFTFLSLLIIGHQKAREVPID